MSSNYTGNPAATEAPSPAPGPGAIPIVVLPSDADPATAASVAQALRVPADFIADINTNVRSANRTWNPPLVASDAPQVAWKDAGGNVRSIVDHNGYPLGRYSKFEEGWDWEAFTSGAVTNTMLPSSTYSRWNINGTVNSAWATSAPSNTYIPTSPFSQITLTAPVNTNNLRINFGSNAVTGLVLPQAYSSIVAEFELVGSVTGTNTVIAAKVALSSNATGVPGAGNEIGIGKRSTDTTWQFYTSNSGTPTFTNSGVSCVDGSLHTFRFELHGASSPYGSAVARFFVDGGAAVTISTNLPPTNGSQLLGPVFSSDCSGSGCTAANFALSPIKVVWNRSLTSTTV